MEKLENLRGISREEFLENPQAQDAAMYNLIIGIEAVVDIGNYFLADKFNQAADTYEDVIKGLGEKGIIPIKFAQESEGMAGFRNVLVHLYEDVNLDTVYYNLQKAPDAFRHFAEHFVEFVKEE